MTEISMKTNGTATLLVNGNNLPADFANRLYVVMGMLFDAWSVKIERDRTFTNEDGEDVAMYHVSILDHTPPPWNPIEEIMENSDFTIPGKMQ